MSDEARKARGRKYQHAMRHEVGVELFPHDKPKLIGKIEAGPARLAALKYLRQAAKRSKTGKIVSAVTKLLK